MTTDPEGAHHLLLAQLVGAFQGSALGFDLLQVVRPEHLVDVQHVELVHLQPLQALLGAPHHFVRGSRVSLGGENEPLTASLGGLADQRLAPAAAVILRRIEIGDAARKRQFECFEDAVVLSVSHQAAAAADRQHGGSQSCAPESASGQPAGSVFGSF